MGLCRRISLVVCIGLAGCVSEPGPQRPHAAPPVVVPAPPVTAPPAPATGARPGVAAPREFSPPAPPTSGGIGFYQSRQEQQLRERIEGSAIHLSRIGDTLRLVLPGNAAFAANSDQIQPRFVELLGRIAPVLKDYNKTGIDIRGYTDATGSFEHNQQLSAQRAQAVSAFLSARQVAAARIRTAGFGPQYPIADNKTDAGRAQNRRIEIDLVPTP